MFDNKNDNHLWPSEEPNRIEYLITVRLSRCIRFDESFVPYGVNGIPSVDRSLFESRDEKLVSSRIHLPLVNFTSHFSKLATRVGSSRGGSVLEKRTRSPFAVHLASGFVPSKFQVTPHLPLPFVRDSLLSFRIFPTISDFFLYLPGEEELILYHLSRLHPKHVVRVPSVAWHSCVSAVRSRPQPGCVIRSRSRTHPSRWIFKCKLNTRRSLDPASFIYPPLPSAENIVENWWD